MPASLRVLVLCCCFLVCYVFYFLSRPLSCAGPHTLVMLLASRPPPLISLVAPPVRGSGASTRVGFGAGSL